MERESYSQPEMASYINRHFVAIKVDYDADPKFTQSLQRAAAVTNLPSGIPLTLFLPPKGTLYFGGTFFPALPTSDKKSLRQALDFALSKYHDAPQSLEASGTRITVNNRGAK